MDRYRNYLICFIFLAFWAGVASDCEAFTQHRAKAGRLDLSNWNFQKQGYVNLDGEWSFYWNSLPSPDDIDKEQPSGYIEVPGTWNKHIKDSRFGSSGHGFAAYRLRVRIPETNEPLALKILYAATSNIIFINGRRVSISGKVGKSSEEMSPSYFPHVARFSSNERELDIVMHISNFHHWQGGAWKSIKLGLADQLFLERQKVVMTDFFIFGGLLFFGIYHIILFLLRKMDVSPLYYGFFCILIAIRIVFTGERAIYVFMPGLDWNLSLRVVYIGLYLAIPVFVLYFQSLFPKELNKKAVIIFSGWGVLLSLITILTPARVFTHTMPVFQLSVFVVILYGSYVATIALIRKRKGSLVFFLGYMIVCLATINDILYSRQIISTQYVIQYGFSFFIIAQSLILAKRFSDAFYKVEDQRLEIQNINQSLRQEIGERRQAENEKETLQQQLLQAQKMEAVGTLAGGIAHDFNNLLQAVKGYTQLLLMKKTENEPDYARLIGIEKASDRAAQLVRQLLLFSRKVETERLMLDLNREVEQAQSLLERTIPKMIDIELDLSSDLMTVKADPVQIEQILLNMAGNAADAMPEGGKLAFKTENAVLDEVFCQKNIGAVPGSYVLLSIYDTGNGMDHETVEHIFEPFFTTKEIGMGTGLGLASVYGIVKKHGGYICCNSEVGAGTTFQIYLPAHEKKAEIKREEVIDQPTRKGMETILLVDDEEQIRDVASELFTEFGYRVMTASSGEQAIDIYKDKSDEIDLVVLDIGMPGMGGYKCFRRIIQYDSDAMILIASGYPVDGQIRKALDSGAAGYIGKPYKLSELLVKTRETLDRRN